MTKGHEGRSYEGIVAVLVRDPESGKVLVIGGSSGRLDLPGGFVDGYDRQPESPAAAALRELREETSIELKEGDLEPVETDVDPRKPTTQGADADEESVAALLKNLDKISWFRGNFSPPAAWAGKGDKDVKAFSAEICEIFGLATGTTHAFVDREKVSKLPLTQIVDKAYYVVVVCA